jgi:hypothetical protein
MQHVRSECAAFTSTAQNLETEVHPRLLPPITDLLNQAQGLSHMRLCSLSQNLWRQQQLQGPLHLVVQGQCVPAVGPCPSGFCCPSRGGAAYAAAAGEAAQGPSSRGASSCCRCSKAGQSGNNKGEAGMGGDFTAEQQVWYLRRRRSSRRELGRTAQIHEGHAPLLYCKRLGFSRAASTA